MRVYSPIEIIDTTSSVRADNKHLNVSDAIISPYCIIGIISIVLLFLVFQMIILTKFHPLRFRPLF